MKKIVFFISFLLLSTLGFSQAKKVATVRIFENSFQVYTKIFVAYEDGEVEIIPLKPFKPSSKESHTLQANQKTITKFMNDMNKKGYILTHFEVSGEETTHTFMVYEKE